ncbi:unnamed protein product [Lactuca virosa]|uniref:F-box domain-containing protein n=1 Tax=Lactuca virosa TaxID=75947 RepID=A0AAU9LHS0_9ASTR|nr:unnamed protein product [Lactuca virosa]
MDSVLDEPVVDAETDRLSSLPHDLIHHILSFMDMKYAVQTCVLSSKWKFIWTTLTHIKFSTSEFQQLGQFIRFARHVIANRNDQTDVSSLDFSFDGTLSQILVKVLLNYVVSHNIRNLNISTFERDRKLPNCIFESQSLKHFTLKNIHEDYCIAPQYPWDLPNLTTLHLNDFVITDGRNENHEYLDLFSKCVNLKKLSITECYMAEVKVFKVCAPRLEDLTITDCFLNKLFISASNLQSFVYGGECPLCLLTNGFQNLEKVDLHLPMPNPLSDFKKEDAFQLLKVLKEFHSTKFINLYSDVIQGLSMYRDVLSYQPSPFNNLKHLNIRQVSHRGKYSMLIVPNHVKNYFLNSSPNVTITTEVPKIKELGIGSYYEADQIINFDI